MIINLCAHPLVDRLVGPGGAVVRASIGLGPADEHVGRPLTALTALAGHPAHGALSPAAGRPHGPRPRPARTPDPAPTLAITSHPTPAITSHPTPAITSRLAPAGTRPPRSVVPA